MLMLIYSVIIILSSFMPCLITSLPAEYNKESNNYNNINNNNTNKVGILIESQEHLIDKKILSVDNNWHNNNNNTYGINVDNNNNDDDDDNNNNNPIRYQHQWLNYEGNQYQTEAAAAAAVNFPLAVHKQGNLKTSTDYSTDSNYQDNVHVADIITPSIPVDEALLLFENFGDKIIKNDDHSNYYKNERKKVEESQNYYFSTELPIENNRDKTIRVSSENYKNALANFKSQLIKNSRGSLNNKKHVTTLTTSAETAAAAAAAAAVNKNNGLPELSRLTFQNFNDSLTDIISENEQTKVTSNQIVVTKFNTEEPIVVSQTGIMINKNYEYDNTARPECNIENENTEVVESQLLSLTTISPSFEKEEEKQLTKSSTDQGTTDYNTPVHSIHSVHSVHSVNSPLFTRELSNRDQDTTSPVVLNSIQARLALVNADKTHFIVNKVQPLSQFKLNGYSDNYPFENINTTNKNNKNVKSIESPATKNVTLTSINHDNDSNNYNDNVKLVEIQKSVELYNSAPIHEIHYPPELSINHPAPPISSASSASSDFVNITSHQDNNHQKNQMSYTDTDISDSNTDFSLKFLSIINQTTPSTLKQQQQQQQQQPVNLNNNIVFDIEKQKIIEINNKNNIGGEIYETQDQLSSSSEFLEYKNKQVVQDINGKNLLIDRESDNVSRYINSYNNNNNNVNDFKQEGYSNLIEKDKIADATDNSEQTVYIYLPPVVSGGYGSIDISNYNINLPINSEIVEQSNYPVDKLVNGVLDITTGVRYSQPYFVNKDDDDNNNNNNNNRVVEKYQKLKLKPKQKHVPVIQAYPVTVEKMSKNKVPSPHQPTKTITSTSNTGSYIQKFVSQPYPTHILEQLPYQVDKVIEMPIQIPSYHPLGEIPPTLLSSSIRFNKLSNNNNPNNYHKITNPSIQSNGLMYPTRLQQIKSEQAGQSFTNGSTINLKGYTIGKQAIMPLMVAMRSPLSKRYSFLSQFGLVKHQKNQQNQQQHIFNYYPSDNFKKQLYNNNNNNNNNNNDLLKQLPISMHHPKSVVDQTSFQWHVIHPSEKQKVTKIEYVGPVPSLTPHHVLNLHQNQVPHPAHQESLHYLGATDTSSSSSSSSTLPDSSFFKRLPEIYYYGKVGNFRQSKMEYGFKPPMVPSIQYDEETATKVDNH